ncbi:ABC transporter ATP-binding protein [Streptomyces sp. NPDC002574]|uniref:ABC transporter ATP-binding protein n=1 Tax=Streptomyces sp. NPDC002574 TaxID=3364652 RepID=UPI003677E65C
MTTDEVDDVLVRCRDAALTFGRGPTAVVAVHGASCEVRAGDRIAVTGPSGSGKSTVLHLMAGLERVTQGEVTWPALTGRVASHIGVVFQGPSLIPALNVAENTALPLVLAGVPESQATQQALAALGHVDAADLRHKVPDELSGGQSQRVAVARVLAMRPRLVLADEPTGQLDRATGQHVMDVLLAAVDDLGAALLVTTHDPSIARRLDQQWSMSDGRLTPAPRSTPRATGPTWTRENAS